MIPLSGRWRGPSTYRVMLRERIGALSGLDTVMVRRALLTRSNTGKVADSFKPADVYWKGWANLGTPRGGTRGRTDAVRPGPPATNGSETGGGAVGHP